MVKRVGSKGPGAIGGNSPIESGKAVGAGKVGNVSEVGTVRSTGGASGTGAVGRRLTSGDREQILALVEQETEKLFADSEIPAKKRKVIEGAVKMAIEASLLPEGEDKKE
jgi:hypothetical protein